MKILQIIIIIMKIIFKTQLYKNYKWKIRQKIMIIKIVKKKKNQFKKHQNNQTIILNIKKIFQQQILIK